MKNIARLLTIMPLRAIALLRVFPPALIIMAWLLSLIWYLNWTAINFEDYFGVMGVKYRELGRTSLKVSEIGLGCEGFAQRQRRRCLS